MATISRKTRIQVINIPTVEVEPGIWQNGSGTVIDCWASCKDVSANRAMYYGLTAVEQAKEITLLFNDFPTVSDSTVIDIDGKRHSVVSIKRTDTNPDYWVLICKNKV